MALAPPVIKHELPRVKTREQLDADFAEFLKRKGKVYQAKMGESAAQFVPLNSSQGKKMTIDAVESRKKEKRGRPI